MFIQGIHWVINVERIIDFETCSNEQCSHLLVPWSYSVTAQFDVHGQDPYMYIYMCIYTYQTFYLTW